MQSGAVLNGTSPNVHTLVWGGADIPAVGLTASVNKSEVVTRGGRHECSRTVGLRNSSKDPDSETPYYFMM